MVEVESKKKKPDNEKKEKKPRKTRKDKGKKRGKRMKKPRFSTGSIEFKTIGTTATVEKIPEKIPEKKVRKPRKPAAPKKYVAPNMGQNLTRLAGLVSSSRQIQPIVSPVNSQLAQTQAILDEFKKKFDSLQPTTKSQREYEKLRRDLDSNNAIIIAQQRKEQNLKNELQQYETTIGQQRDKYETTMEQQRDQFEEERQSIRNKNLELQGQRDMLLQVNKQAREKYDEESRVRNEELKILTRELVGESLNSMISKIEKKTELEIPQMHTQASYELGGGGGGYVEQELTRSLSSQQRAEELKKQKQEEDWLAKHRLYREKQKQVETESYSRGSLDSIGSLDQEEIFPPDEEPSPEPAGVELQTHQIPDVRIAQEEWVNPLTFLDFPPPTKKELELQKKKEERLKASQEKIGKFLEEKTQRDMFSLRIKENREKKLQKLRQQQPRREGNNYYDELGILQL